MFLRRCTAWRQIKSTGVQRLLQICQVGRWNIRAGDAGRESVVVEPRTPHAISQFQHSPQMGNLTDDGPIAREFGAVISYFASITRGGMYTSPKNFVLEKPRVQ